MTDWTTNGWFRHRVNSIASDSRLRRLVKLHGASGYAVYFLSLECIYQGKLGSVEVEDMADFLGMNPEEITAIMEDAETRCGKLIFRGDDGFWHSKKASELMGDDEAKRESRRDTQKRYRENQKTSRDSNETSRDNHATSRSFENKSQEKENKNKSKEKDKVPKESDRPTDRPTLENVIYIMRKVGRNFDASRFFDYWEQKGWLIDGEPIRSLESVVRSWPNDKPAPTPIESHPEYAKRMEEARMSL